MLTEVVIIGAGGHASVVVDTLELSMPGVVFRLVDADKSKVGSTLLGHVIQDEPVWQDTPSAQIHIAIGVNSTRAQVGRAVRQCGHDMISLLHPMSTVSRYAEIGPGCFIAAASVIGPGAKLEVGVIVNHSAVVDHDCRVEEFSHVAPNATLGGGVRVGKRVLIGAGVTVLPGVFVGDDIVVGAGAVVTHDLHEQGCRYVGVPAKRVHDGKG